MENTKMNEIVEGATSKKGLGIAIGLGVAGLAVAGLAAVGAIVGKKFLNRHAQEADIQEAKVIEDNKKSKAK